MIKRVLATIFTLAITFPVLAQDVPPDETFSPQPAPPLRLGETLLNLPSPRTLPARTWELRFAHRFSQPINEGDVHSLWGLDSSADVAIGLVYSPRDRMQIGIYRTDLQDDIEFSIKQILLTESFTVPLSVSARGGFDWRTEERLDDRVSGFAQVVLSKRVGPKMELFAIPTYVSNTTAFEHVVNLPLGVAYSMKPHLSLILEVIPPNTDLPDTIDSGTGWALGLKRVIGGHYFEVMLGSSRATHVDQYAGSDFLGGVDSGDVHLGFNIERRFGTGRRRR